MLRKPIQPGKMARSINLGDLPLVDEDMRKRERIGHQFDRTGNRSAAERLTLA